MKKVNPEDLVVGQECYIKVVTEKVKTLKLQRVTRYFGYILLAVVTFTPLQWCWNKFASMCKINLWAMKNTNGKMCLWRFNLGEPTWEKVL